jgi:predicted ABC-type ATPase
MAARSKLLESRETDKIYKLPNGHWAPDRLPVHRAILAKLLPLDRIAAATPPPGEKPTLYVLGGRGGSGKGWFTRPGGSVDISKAVYINNDDVKESLPEYRGWNAGHLHEEASEIGEAMEAYARDNKLNVVVDATLKSEGSLAKRIAAYKAAGYRISGHYMYASPATAAERALQRFVSGNAKNGKGRFVPPEYSLNSTTNEHTFDSHRKDMDYWEVYDNSGDAPKLHSRKE